MTFIRGIVTTPGTPIEGMTLLGGAAQAARALY